MNTIEDYLAASLNRQADMEDLIQRLWVRIEHGNVLLQSALLELHQATAPNTNVSIFISKWHREKGARL